MENGMTETGAGRKPAEFNVEARSGETHEGGEHQDEFEGNRLEAAVPRQCLLARADTRAAPSSGGPS